MKMNDSRKRVIVGKDTPRDILNCGGVAKGALLFTRKHEIILSVFPVAVKRGMQSFSLRIPPSRHESDKGGGA